jgi:hypothetical protein
LQSCSSCKRFFDEYSPIVRLVYFILRVIAKLQPKPNSILKRNL